MWLASAHVGRIALTAVTEMCAGNLRILLAFRTREMMRMMRALQAPRA